MQIKFTLLQCERNNSVNTKGSRFGLRTFVKPRGEAEGQYSYPKANTTGRGAVTGQIWKHPFDNIILL